MADRNLQYVPLAAIQRAIRNPKRHDGAGIRRSLEHHGLAELPLLDERTGRLVAGHGRIDQALQMHANGQDPPDGIRTAADGTWLIPVIRGWSSRSDADAEAYLVGSNRLVATGGWDDAELAELLADVAAVAVDGDLLAAAGFDQDYLDDLAAALEEVPDLPVPPDPYAAPDRPLAAPPASPPQPPDPTAGNQRRVKTLAELARDYNQSTSRMLVLAYEGARYVWMVNSLAALAEQWGLESNADTVLRLVEQAVGEQAPDA